MEEELFSPPEELKPVKEEEISTKKFKRHFYPPVPTRLPSLDEGYLFHQTRKLDGVSESEGEEELKTAENAGDAEAPVDMTKVVYIGSIITGNINKAIISYPAGKTRARGRNTPVRGRSASSSEYAHLAEGDDFSGYKVTSVAPGKIVFEKGGETIEKPLYDASKKRSSATASKRKETSPRGAGAQRKAANLFKPDEDVTVVGGGSQPGTVKPAPRQQPASRIIRRPQRPPAGTQRATIVRPGETP